MMPDGKRLGIDGPPENYPIAGIINRIVSFYPRVPKECIKLVNKGVSLDLKKSIKDYNISYGNNEVFAVIPAYFFGSQGLIKMLKTGGYWEYEPSVVTNLGLDAQFLLKKT